MTNQSKIEMKPSFDFNADLDKVSAEIKNKSEETKTPQTSEVKMEIQPNDKVLFNGKPATVASVWPDGSVVILQDGMTIECTQRQLEIYGRVDTMEAPMKFKDGMPVQESMVLCNIKINGQWSKDFLHENFFVNFNEWSRKKGQQKVRVICEGVDDVFSAPVTDINLLELPDGNIDQTDGYVNGVITSGDEADRKVMIKAVDYATSTDDSTQIPVLYITDDGYKAGKCPKSMLKTLSV